MPKQNLLNKKQLAVLRWVGEGRPKGVYENGFDHRVTARALERRGLLSVQGHGRSWRASLTDEGRYYLGHGSYPPSEDPDTTEVKLATTSPPASEPTYKPVDDLLDRLESEGGVLRFDAPSDAERIGYVRAVRQLRFSGGLGSQRRLKVTGTRRGPLTIELIQFSTQAEMPPQIPMSAEADRNRPEIQALIEHASLLAVDEATRPRAWALVQGISEECVRRGWTLSVDKDPSFLITVGEDSYRCVLSEERVKRDVYTDKDLTERKYEWQRVSPTRMEVWSGRLKLELDPGYNSRWWADRQRWTLVSKLPEFFDIIEEWSHAAQDRREKLEAYHAKQVKEWEEAIPKAREAYLLKLNADRARQQAEQWDRAAQLRSYSQAIRHQAEEFDEQAQRHVLEWATWIDEHADRIDPLNDKSQLTMSESSTLGAKELDPYMPHGWSVENPPEPSTWLP
ncbi:MAG: hypothetical protein ABF780_02685 [Bifidobacterium aquikefiri]|uniref:PE-PGRS family protein n=1 Tax=Bifidobacterium aquikefiri TaxID=1653207 RepID=A0A261GAA6_9BIFI|nr:hypothetical protein [Bifidobacterium aquikefiri]OZG68362.1 PE-PGRS family protein [Bifidobacterium aquikefiri]